MVAACPRLRRSSHALHRRRLTYGRMLLMNFFFLRSTCSGSFGGRRSNTLLGRFVVLLSSWRPFFVIGKHYTHGRPLSLFVTLFPDFH